MLLLGFAKDENDVMLITTPLLMSSLKMLFIIDWNVAGLLVRLNNPQFVQKAAFHSSPSLICTLLYPQHMSS